MGQRHKIETRPAQQDSEISILKNSPSCLYCPYCPLVFKTTLPQRDSGISSFGWMGELPMVLFEFPKRAITRLFIVIVQYFSDMNLQDVSFGNIF